MKLSHILLAILSVTLWGISYPLIKIITLQFPPLFASTLRLLVIGILFCPFVKKPKGEWFKLSLISITLFSLTFSLTTIAIQEIDASIAAFITSLEVPFAAVVSYLFLKEKLRKLQIFGLFVSLLGVYFIVESPEIAPSQLWRIILLLIVAFSYALSAVLVKGIKKTSSFSITVWSATLAAPQLAIFSILFEKDHMSLIKKIDLNSTMIIFLLTLLSMLAFYFWNLLIKKYRVNQIMPFILLVPVSSLISSYFLLGETTHIIAIFGGLLTIFGVWLQSRK